MILRKSISKFANIFFAGRCPARPLGNGAPWTTAWTRPYLFVRLHVDQTPLSPDEQPDRGSNGRRTAEARSARNERHRACGNMERTRRDAMERDGLLPARCSGQKRLRPEGCWVATE